MSMKITPALERALYDANTSIEHVLTYTKELSHAEFFELSNVHKEFDIIRRSLEKRR